MTPANEGFRAPKGTLDLVPPASGRHLAAVRAALDMFAAAGYEPIETPIFEHTEVFERGVGAGSEVVTKQMYSFTDLGGRSLTLRPEGTAPVVRAVLEHGLHKGPLPVKLAYAGPMFRQERPQKGRYRQFFQVGIEAVGSASPAVDAEVVEIGQRFIESCGVEPDLAVNSIGHPAPECRDGYVKVLAEWLGEHRDELATGDRGRAATNPLRTFDSKEPETIAAIASAPAIDSYLCPECREHFDAVRVELERLGIPHRLEPRLVRGLDYYTRTAFEYVAPGLGSQNAVGGGGRYDGLSESLGGPPLAGIGFALGIDRILLAAGDGVEAGRAVAAYVVAVGEAARSAALLVATELRRAGVGADLDFSERSMKGQMKDAARSGARWAVILGDEEIDRGDATVKDLQTGWQSRIPLGELASTLQR